MVVGLNTSRCDSGDPGISRRKTAGRGLSPELRGCRFMDDSYREVGMCRPPNRRMEEERNKAKIHAWRKTD